MEQLANRLERHSSSDAGEHGLQHSTIRASLHASIEEHSSNVIGESHAVGSLTASQHMKEVLEELLGTLTIALNQTNEVVATLLGMFPGGGCHDLQQGGKQFGTSTGQA